MQHNVNTLDQLNNILQNQLVIAIVMGYLCVLVAGGTDELDISWLRLMWYDVVVSELDEVESERRRNDCMETMSDLESQFAELKEQ